MPQEDYYRLPDYWRITRYYQSSLRDYDWELMIERLLEIVRDYERLWEIFIEHLQENKPL